MTILGKKLCNARNNIFVGRERERTNIFYILYHIFNF